LVLEPVVNVFDNGDEAVLGVVFIGILSFSLARVILMSLASVMLFS
jgi:hypothetical protein